MKGLLPAIHGHDEEGLIMGFIAQGLGPTDSAIVSRMGPEIVRVLRKASAEIQRGNGRAESTLWFGDT
ncbi:MAG: hypothetical protein L6Q68_20240, partial [Aquabacterium sp.]|nr:hypothetical protein [Aquabacterium sp.]